MARQHPDPPDNAPPASEDWRLNVSRPTHDGAGLPLQMVVDDNGEFAEEEVETPADRVYAILEAAKAEERSSLKLFRVTGPNRFAWCQDYSIEEFESGSFNMIRATWGPGEYELRFFAVHPGTRRYCVRAKPRITIEPLPGALANPASPVAAPQAAISPELAATLQGIQQTQARLVEALSQRPDPMLQMQSMLGLFGAFREAMGGSGNNAKSSISEVLTAVREIREVAKEVNPPENQSDPENPLSMLPGILDLVGKFAPGQGQQPAAPNPQFPPVTLPEGFNQQPAVALPNPSIQSPQTPVDQSTAEGDELAAMELVLFKGYLKRVCEMGSNPANLQAAADLAYSKMPDEVLDNLSRPDWFDMLKLFAPEIVSHRAWLETVRQKVLALHGADSAG